MRTRLVIGLLAGATMLAPQAGRIGNLQATPVAAAGCTAVKAPASDTLPTAATDFTTDANIQANFNQARTAEGCTTPLTLPGDYDTQTPVQQALTLINLERTDRGFATLSLDTTLISQIASGHSMEMATYDYFAHGSPVNLGLGFPDRWRINPILSTASMLVGENAFFGQGGTDTAAEAVYDLMYEDSGSGWGHRDNFLGFAGGALNNIGGFYNWIGIGHAMSNTTGKYYWTYDIGQARAPQPYTPPAMADTTAPSLTNLTFKNGTATVTATDTPPSADQAGVDRVVFYTNKIVQTGGDAINPTFNVTDGSNGGNGNNYSATVTVNKGDALHAVGTDGSGNFTDITRTITASLLTGTAVQSHGGRLTFRWTLARGARVLGFQVFAGRHALNAHIIPAHRSPNYVFTVRRAVTGPFTLHIIATNGHVTSVYLA